MKNFSLKTVIEALFLFFLIFLILLVLLSFFINKNFALFFSSLLSIVFCLLIFNFSSLKKSKLRFKKEETTKIQKLKIFFLLGNFNTLSTLFLDLFSFYNIQATVKKDYLYLPSLNQAVLFYFSSPLLKTDLIKEVNKKEEDHLIFFCVDVDEETLSLSKTFYKKITIIKPEELYLKLKEASLLPILPDLFKSEKKRFDLSFIKTQGKRAFFSGLFLLIFSYFTPYKVYYLIFSVLFLIFSLVIFISNKFCKKNKTPFF